MITSSIKELEKTRAKVVQLEKALAKELASLPSAYGFDSLKEFVAALKSAGGKGRAGRPKMAGAPKTRKRAKITDAVRAKVKTLVKAGKTGGAIAKTLGISLPSVQNIKKASGLVKARGKASSKPKVRRAPMKSKAAPKPKAKKKRVLSKKPATSESKPFQAQAEATAATSG